MNHDEAKEAIKPRLSEYLAHTGREIHEPKGGACPVCGGGKKTPCAHIKDDMLKCFSCGWHGDIFDLIGLDCKEDDFPGRLRIAAEHFNISLDGTEPARREPAKATQPAAAVKPPADFTAFYKKCQAQAETGISYLMGRGISREVCQAHKIGYDQQRRAVIIPITPTFYISRSIEGKAFHNPAGAKTAIMNADHMDREDPVFIVEGAIDALSIETAGGRAIALNSTSNARQALEIMKAKKSRALIILALDNDEAGQTCAAELEEGLQQHVLLLQANISGEHKDANDRLRADPDGLRGAILEALEQAAIMQQYAADQTEADRLRELAEYEKNSTAGYLGDFMRQVEAMANRPAISTGFKQLDYILDGGLFDGLYILGAISSLGKTTFVLQMADHIAASGHDVLLFSLEMARFELAGKSISRQTFILDRSPGRTLAKTTRGIINGSLYQEYARNEPEGLNLIFEAISAYGKAAGRIYILEASGQIGATEIRAAVAKHKQLTGRQPVVFIDYLQILKPRDTKSSDKQNTDWAVSELKRISRDYKVPVFAVSSLNRDNYSSPINMTAFKESGAIEYSSDVLIGLQVDGADEYSSSEAKRAQNYLDTELKKKQDPRGIELKILKNRNGRFGDPIKYRYYAKYNYFEEDPQEFQPPADNLDVNPKTHEVTRRRGGYGKGAADRDLTEISRPDID